MRKVWGFLSRLPLQRFFCFVLAFSIILSVTSIESDASMLEDWKDGSFVVNIVGSQTNVRIYSGENAQFNKKSRQFSNESEYTYSDVHFIEGNEYIIDSSSLTYEVIKDDIHTNAVRYGSVTDISISDEPNADLNSDFKDKPFVYSDIPSMISYMRFYAEVSGQSTNYSSSVGYLVNFDWTYDVSFRVNFKYQGKMDNEVVPDVPDVPPGGGGNGSADSSLIGGWEALGGYGQGYFLHVFGHNVSNGYSPKFSFGPSGSAVIQMQENGNLVFDSGALSGTYSGTTSESGSYTGSTSSDGWYQGETSSDTRIDMSFGGLVNEFEPPSSITDFAGSIHGDLESNGTELGDVSMSGDESGTSSSSGNESGTLSFDLSDASGAYTGIMQSKVVYSYDLDIPIILDFGEDCRKTFDGELRVPMIVRLDVPVDSPDIISLVGSEIEMFDSTGQRINATVKTKNTAYAGRAFGVSADMRFDKRFIDKRIYGTLRLHVTRELVSDGETEHSAMIGVEVGHDNDNFFFIDWCDVQVYNGDVSEMEVVTYQKSGYYETSADGSVTWIDGETVTEYVESAEGVKQNEELKNQTNVQKNIFQKLTDFFGSFFKNLFDTVISLIVPSNEEMQELLNRMITFFSDRFGFLFYPFELLGQALQIFMQDGSTSLTFPAFSIMGQEVWSDISYDLTENQIVNTVFTYVRYVTGAILAMAFINYLRDFFDKRFGGGGN